LKNPFRRKDKQPDAQLAELQRAFDALSEYAGYRLSAPGMRQALAELDPRLLDLLLDQSRYDTIIGQTTLGAGSRRRAVEACRYAYQNDVQIANACKTWTDWGFGRVLGVVAVDDAANEVWQECWKAPRNRAMFGQARIHELSTAVLNDGEVFFVGYASRQDGETTWRTFDTCAVTDIIHAKNDTSINVWYIVQLEERQVAIPDAFTYFALRDRFEGVEIPAGIDDINAAPDALGNGGTFAVIVPAQRSRDKDGRGWPEFYKALPWSEVYAQMLREYASVFSAVAMYVDKLKVKGGSRTVTDVIAALQSSLATTTGAYTDTNPRPAAGTTWVENDAADRSRLPLGSAAGDAQTGTLTVGTQLATALRVKLSDIGRSDAFQNKATADIAAESPQQSWQRYQLFWSSVWGDIVETTLRLRSLFTGATFASYEAEVSTNLPLDIDTAEISTAMDAITKAAAGMTLDAGLALRANAALAALMLTDLGVDNVAEIIEPKTPTQEDAEAQAAPLTEMHIALKVLHACPLGCGGTEALSYEGHGPLLVCATCGKTYNPEVE
jgi:hypothetical protein